MGTPPDYILTLAISAFSVGPYLGYFFPILKTSAQANVTFTALLIALLVFINVFGLKESSWFSLMLTGFDIITQVSLMGLGIFFLLNFNAERADHRGSGYSRGRDSP